jgi:hypothetical protein
MYDVIQTNSSSNISNYESNYSPLIISQMTPSNSDNFHSILSILFATPHNVTSTPGTPAPWFLLSDQIP